jgi:Phage integrase, N-terminal SAM-like domain
MIEELDDFVHHCRVERRLSPLTCQAYERDVRACLECQRDAGLTSWGQVRLVHLRRFLAAEAEYRPASSSQARTVAALKGFFRFPGRDRSGRPRPGESASCAEEARARSAAACAVRLRGAAPLGVGRARLGGRRPRAAAAERPPGQRWAGESRPDPSRAGRPIHRAPGGSRRHRAGPAPFSACRADGYRRRS